MRLVLYTSALVFAATPALADDPPNAGLSMNLDVVARQLDIARQQIQPSLGATTYNFSPQSLQDIPQGANAPLDKVRGQRQSVRPGADNCHINKIIHRRHQTPQAYD